MGACTDADISEGGDAGAADSGGADQGSPLDDAGTPPDAADLDASAPDAGDAHPSGDGGPAGDAGPAPLPARELCMEAASFACEARGRCCSDPAVSGVPLEDCLSATVLDCGRLFGDILMEAERPGGGRVAYDPVEARVALDEARAQAATCDVAIADWLTTPGGIFRALRGTVGAGGTCATGYADLPGVFACRRSEELACHATRWLPLQTMCAPFVTEGGRCWFDGECATGHCLVAMLLAGGMCQPQRADGSPCDRWQQCSSKLCVDGSCIARTADSVYCANIFDNPVLAPM